MIAFDVSTPDRYRRIALVLGGGGLKGFAHLGVLRALEERGLVPWVTAGTSIGGLIAAAYAGGRSLDDLARRATSLRRRDLFRINHLGMITERMKAPSIYLEEPLRALAESVSPGVRFDQLPRRLLINTVDVEHGTQVVWGLPGLQDVYVADAVYASCALPGFFPPGRIGGRLCADGGTVDNLPVGIAAQGADAVIAVDVGSADLQHDEHIGLQGFAAIYMRAATMMMHSLQEFPLARWSGPPMILIRPKLANVDWLGFGNAEQVIEEGYRAAAEALARADEYFSEPSGIYPRERMRLRVDRERCTGCGLCAALAPRAMGLDATGKAFPHARTLDWSPADGDFVRHCPTGAIVAEPVGPEKIVEPPVAAVAAD